MTKIKARLRLLPLLLVISACMCAGYGWCLEKKSNIAGPLILQFVSECIRNVYGDT